MALMTELYFKYGPRKESRNGVSNEVVLNVLSVPLGGDGEGVSSVLPLPSLERRCLLCCVSSLFFGGGDLK